MFILCKVFVAVAIIFVFLLFLEGCGPGFLTPNCSLQLCCCDIEVVSMVDPAVCNSGQRLLWSFVPPCGPEFKGSSIHMEKDGRRDL